MRWEQGPEEIGQLLLRQLFGRRLQMGGGERWSVGAGFSGMQWGCKRGCNGGCNGGCSEEGGLQWCASVRHTWAGNVAAAQLADTSKGTCPLQLTGRGGQVGCQAHTHQTKSPTQAHTTGKRCSSYSFPSAPVGAGRWLGRWPDPRGAQPPAPLAPQAAPKWRPCQAAGRSGDQCKGARRVSEEGRGRGHSSYWQGGAREACRSAERPFCLPKQSKPPAAVSGGCTLCPLPAAQATRLWPCLLPSPSSNAPHCSPLLPRLPALARSAHAPAAPSTCSWGTAGQRAQSRPAEGAGWEETEGHVDIYGIDPWAQAQQVGGRKVAL